MIKITDPRGPKLVSVCCIKDLVCLSLTKFSSIFTMLHENGTKLKKKMTLLDLNELKNYRPVSYNFFF